MIRKLSFTAAVLLFLAIPLTHNIKDELTLYGKEIQDSHFVASLASVVQASNAAGARNDTLTGLQTLERYKPAGSPSLHPSLPAGMLIGGGQISVNGKPVETGATVLVDNTVSTGPNSFAVISFGALGQVELPPNTTFTMAMKEGKFIGLDNSTKESVFFPLLRWPTSQDAGKDSLNQSALSNSLSTGKSGFSGLFGSAARASLNVTTGNPNGPRNENNGNNGNNGNHFGWCIGQGHHNHGNGQGNGHEHHDHNCSPIRPCS
jgi:hypothetical protein